MFTALIDPSPLCRWQFVAEYESQNEPVILTRATAGWGANESWQPEALKKRFGQHTFEVFDEHFGAVDVHRAE